MLMLSLNPPVWALGGGGARAISHIGVLRQYLQNNLTLPGLAGASFGGIVAALVAFSDNIPATLDSCVNFFASHPRLGGQKRPPRNPLDPGIGLLARLRKYAATTVFAQLLATRHSFLSQHPLYAVIDELLPDTDIAAAKIPLAIVALDLVSCQVKVFRQGRLRQLLKAGVSIGVLYHPFEYADMLLVDAAPVCAVPVYAARELTQTGQEVWAVDLRASVTDTFSPQDGFDIWRRIETAQSQALTSLEVSSADKIFRPAVQNYFWGDFSKSPQIAALGQQAYQTEFSENLQHISKMRAQTAE